MAKVMKSKLFLCIGLLAALYLLTAFTSIPVLSDVRNLWIETAMTTGDHQWLAYIFPSRVIEKVMSRQINAVDGIAGLEAPEDNGDGGGNAERDMSMEFFRPAFFADFDSNMHSQLLRYKEQLEIKKAEEADLLKQKRALRDGIDQTGREVLVNDIEQEVMISLVKGITYTGRIVQVADPSRVFVAATDQKGTQGQLICDYLNDYDAIVGVNASGFKDYNGNGMGGDIIGATRTQGQDWGNVMYGHMTIGFNAEHRLLAGEITNWDAYKLRDAIQFGPVLIKDGEILTEGSAGWGLQPRTIIGQRADGVVLLLVVDGRKPGYSIGATMGDCADVLRSYGAVTAAACDGGSSSVLAYNGEIINRPSTPMTTGRYLPNAILIKAKEGGVE